MREVVFGFFVVGLGPTLFVGLRSLDVVDEVFVSAAARAVVVRHAVAFLVEAELERRVQQLALEVGLLSVENHLFAVLIWLELLVLARIVWRVRRELR